MLRPKVSVAFAVVKGPNRYFSKNGLLAIAIYMQWNLSNPDTHGAEGVPFSEVS